MKINAGSLFWCIQIAVVAVFAGQAWLHFSVGAPYRALFWDETWMKPLLQLLGWQWSDYIQSERVDAGISVFTKVMGGLFATSALVALFISRVPNWLSKLLWLGAFGLFLLAFLQFKARFFHAGQLLEYALQFSSPVLLVWLYQTKLPSKNMLFAWKIAMSLTFICHGLYAVNYYPRPGNFTEMTMNILHLSETQAIQGLQIAGILDFTASVLLFLPFHAESLALCYMVLWGFLTSIARPWAYLQIDFFMETTLRWLPEVLIRFPHFLVPLALLLYRVAWKNDGYKH
ncbi:MAG: hypothetical protein HC892_13805 [Saprospiraceae bacterium]|nr:hypothetical protein [Saprospiraceae bacterium]